MHRYLRHFACLGVMLMVMLGVSVAQSSNGNQTSNSAEQQNQSAMQGSKASQNNSNLSSQDQEFAKKAAEINLAEQELGKLAQQKASNNDVKQFAQMMVNDHSKAAQELKGAVPSGVQLPSQPNSQQQSTKQELSSQSGSQFDQAYIRQMLQGHDKAVQAFENELQNGQNQQLKQYAAKELRTIQDHIRVAENLAGRMQMSGKSGLNDPGKAIAASNQQASNRH